MTKNLIGDLLNSFREYRNLSIKELADGICTEEELISFENDETYPRLDVIYKLADRLNVNVGYFFDLVSENSDNYYTTTVIQLIQKHKRERNYEAIFNIVKKEIKSPFFSTPVLKQYLKWHEGISIFYIHNEINRAITVLNEAISITNPNRTNFSEREIEILISIGLLYYENEDYQNALSIFLEALTFLNKLPYIMDFKVKIRLLFSISQVLTEIDRYEESLEYCEEGISLCINSESLYCFNEFYYQTGENYVRLGDVEKGKVYLEKCIQLLKLERKTKLVKIIKLEIEKLLEDC